MKCCVRMVVILVALVWLARPSFAAEAKLQPADYVAVIGDSITEQKLYSLYIEDYLLMCQPAADLRVTQFGWGGETAPGFARRMANDMLRFQPTVATTCFGMNDGGYSPLDDAKALRYREGQKSIVAQLKQGGVRLIVVGSSGPVDLDTFRNSPEAAKTYNQTLASLRDIAREVANADGVVFANVFDPMMEAMTKAKAKYGKAYNLCGGDGVHPDRNGHLVMAYAFLKALGCDGNVGTINVNLTANTATATAGHQVRSCEKGIVELESTRYPFCFYGEPDRPSSTRGVLEFCPFNEELNRFMLVVTGAPTGKVRVNWGDAAKEFSAAELAAGINLAAAFLDNPFSEPFRKVESVLAQQQNLEVQLVKNLMHNLPSYQQVVPEEAAALDRIARALVKKDQEARNASAAAVQPVRHTLKLEAVQ